MKKLALALPMVLLVGACAATDQEAYTLETWPNRDFFPPEFCWDLATLDETTPGYDSLKEWCTERDARGDFTS